ncbi:MAG: prepilin-type N-terminal cleavage/methylation domain-containing protein [Mariprofundaceae bacterium]|nr:prepilin-type N-terminal cleavage/methylation domain-containing protein [Mariprofundaceae bacterium]
MNLRIDPNLTTSVSHTQPMGVIPANKGFTLVEIMITVTIAGVLAFIGIPAFKENLEKGAVESISRSLMFHMKEARVTAMAESRKVSISFDAYSYTYDSYAAGQSCRRCKSLNIPYADFSVNATVVKKNTTLPPQPVSFASRGTAGISSIVISSGNHSANIVVNTIGRAYVK